MRRELILKYLKQYKIDNGQNYTINKIGVFGSAARDEMTNDSDVDVVVELEKADLFYLIAQVFNFFRQITFFGFKPLKFGINLLQFYQRF